MMGISEDEFLVEQILDDISTIMQVDDDTILTPMRVETSTDWPPAPPPPAEEELEMFEDETDLALGTESGTPPAPRHAGIYMAVRRPPTPR